VAEEDDLPAVSRLVVESFGADAIRLSSDLQSFERAMIAPAAGLWNGYSGLVAFAEVLHGLRSRTRARRSLGARDPGRYLDAPPVRDVPDREEQMRIASGSSVVLALARNHSARGDGLEVLASVELQLQPCDAKIPFALPFLDELERRLASALGSGPSAGPDPHHHRELQPYLANLCVGERARGRGIGRALVRAAEHLSRRWSYPRVYLHVDPGNRPARRLYRGEGYREAGLRWDPFWAGRAAGIGYYVKDVGRR
jgi:ribosomal protein S18 acetylase RimI-like enzyme